MISKDKKYRTRDGRDVRIYAVDGGCGHTVHGAYFSRGQWLLSGWQHVSIGDIPDERIPLALCIAALSAREAG